MSVTASDFQEMIGKLYLPNGGGLHNPTTLTFARGSVDDSGAVQAMVNNYDVNFDDDDDMEIVWSRDRIACVVAVGELANALGITEGDVLIRVNGQPVSDIVEFSGREVFGSSAAAAADGQNHLSKRSVWEFNGDLQSFLASSPRPCKLTWLRTGSGEQGDVANRKSSFVHLPSTKDAEAALPCGIPGGRPFAWDVAAVAQFLTAIGQGHMVSVCQRAYIDGIAMCSMNERSAIDLGFTEEEVLAYKEMMVAIELARKQSSQEAYQMFIGDRHENLGVLVAKRPYMSIFISLFVVLVLSSGIGMLEGSNVLAGFLPVHNDFLDNFASELDITYVQYDAFRESFERPRFSSLIVTPKDGDMLSTPVLTELFTLKNHVEQLRVSHGGATVQFTDLCITHLGECHFDSVLKFWENNLTALSESTLSNAAYLTRFEKKDLDSVLGGVTMNTSATGSISARGTIITLSIRDTGSDALDSGSASMLFEEALVNLVLSSQFMHCNVYVNTARSLEDESVDAWNAMMPKFLGTITLMVAYCMWTMGSATRKQNDVRQVRSQYFATGLVVFSPVLASMAAFGLMGYCGCTLNTMCMFIPFLVLGKSHSPPAFLQFVGLTPVPTFVFMCILSGIGLDDCYVILNYIQLAPKILEGESLEHLFGKVMRRAGAAIFATTLTDCVGFFVGLVVSIDTQQGFVNFCFGMIFALIFDYILQYVYFALIAPNHRLPDLIVAVCRMTLFLPVIVLNYQHDIDRAIFGGQSPQIHVADAKPKTDDDVTMIQDIAGFPQSCGEDDAASSAAPNDGIAKDEDGENDSYEGLGQDSLRWIFEKCWAPLLTGNPLVKWVVLLLDVLLITGAALAASDMGTGMHNDYFFLDGSYMKEYIDNAEQVFMAEPNMMHLVMGVDPNKPKALYQELFSVDSQIALNKLVSDFSNRGDVLYVDNWLAELLADNGGVAPTSDADAIAIIALYGNKYTPYFQLGADGQSIAKLMTSVHFLAPQSIEDRVVQYTQFKSMGEKFFPQHPINSHIQRFKVIAASEKFAIDISQFQTSKQQLIQATFISVYGVFMAMSVTLPFPAAFFCCANLCGVVTIVIGECCCMLLDS
jgi:hypothetical protein